MDQIMVSEKMNMKLVFKSGFERNESGKSGSGESSSEEVDPENVDLENVNLKKGPGEIGSRRGVYKEKMS